MGKTRKESKRFRSTAKVKGGRNARLTHARAIAEVELKYQIVGLRKDGYTHKQIADQLGISPDTVASKLSDILTNTIIKYQESTEESRQLQVEQLDQLIKTYTPLANEYHNELRLDPRTKQEAIVIVPPDPSFAKVLLDCMNRRAKLLGLDIPEIKKLEMTGIREYVGVDLEKV